MIQRYLAQPDVTAGIVPDATTDEIAAISAKVKEAAPERDGPSAAEEPHVALALVDRIDIAPGELRITLSASGRADLLDTDPNRIADDLITITSPFRHRKRGVETKLIIGDQPTEMDETLFRNIARAHRYFDLIRSGRTYSEIADQEDISKRRVQQLIELAFLAPDVIRTVQEGRQPTGLTPEWLMRHAFPPVWKDQREHFSTL